MSTNTHDMMSSARYFTLVCVSALAISFIVSLIVFQLGLPVRVEDYIRLNLFVTACITIPTAIIATLHESRTRNYQRRLEELAWTDELTGLLNRRFFVRAADEESVRMRRTRKTAAVAIFDLDYFKQVNDRYGHSAGDRVLKAIAQIAHAELRGPFDKLGRWGGEEFVVLLSDVSPDTARIVCERLRNRIQSATIEAGERQIGVSASFGFCLLEAGADVSLALEAADHALYEAKRLGRNRVESAEYPGTLVQNVSEFPKRTVDRQAVVPAADEAELAEPHEADVADVQPSLRMAASRAAR